MNVELSRISRRFGSLQALSSVSVTIRPGTVHALVGENGAGKSTLARILGGLDQPDDGEILVDGRPVQYRSPRAALADGITIIAQELSLEPGRTVLENVFLGIESRRWGQLDRRAMRQRYDELTASSGLSLAPNAVVGRMRTAEQQKVEILRALARDARLVIMDEPTAALTADESERLLEVVRGLRADGTTIVYVSHFLEEVLAIADDVTVLRDGTHVVTAPAAEQTPHTLVSAMLGGPSDLSFPDRAERGEPGEVALSVRDLSRPPDFADIEFEVRAGEILGIAGLVGSGRSEVARAVFGADRRGQGRVEVAGRALRGRSPREAIQAGLVMLPESRKEQGLLMRRSLGENVALPHLTGLSRLGVIDSGREETETRDVVRRLDVRGAGSHTRITKLSGGNQQKAMFAKWLLRPPKVFIIDEPTRGVDIGAKHAIYRIIHSLAADGMAVLLISSEIEEILGLSDRVLVMRHGRLVAEFEHAQADQDAILRAAFGTHHDTPQEA
ncbi:sugar ABC transporter ATP-binding protein [Plantactinospora sp. GCM10030261]|uniref:sugar ABC transporter ATP-binding protein n=1 Tax=Plantactinospora sp. GCM10030261 TaxID=3273420 RepID=UPI003619E025